MISKIKEFIVNMPAEPDSLLYIAVNLILIARSNGTVLKYRGIKATSWETKT